MHAHTLFVDAMLTRMSTRGTWTRTTAVAIASGWMGGFVRDTFDSLVAPFDLAVRVSPRLLFPLPL